MSDPTKKSIIINQSFLSGSNKITSSLSNNNLSKKNRPKLSDEIIKPNKLKKMLLDKINAKRKAEQTSASSTVASVNNNANNNVNIDISKESKIFSNEFKKSLDFLDNYINTKNPNPKIKRANDNPQSKTLRRQNIASGNLTTDILKSLQNSKHSSQQQHRPSQNPSPVYTPTMIQQPVVTQPQIVMPNINMRAPSPTAHIPAPIFQKIQLQLPPPQQIIAPRPSQSVPSPHMQPRINLEIGKNSPGNMIYTELPPELQSSALPDMSSASMMGEMQEMGEMQDIMNINNQEVGYDGEQGYDDNDSNDIMGKTSLITASSTFSPVKLFDDAPYGCLKNGKKPTFRAYNKTIKHNLRFDQDDNNNDMPHTERQSKLKELQDKHKRKSSLSTDNTDISPRDETEDETGDNNLHNKTQHLSRTKIRRRLRKTITKKFKLGKQGDTVGVLIKNNDTRKNIQREHGLLKNKKLSDVKKYLVEKNLIKIGSMAPPYIVRKIYEDAMLTGEIENVGKGVILHNFLEDKKSW